MDKYYKLKELKSLLDKGLLDENEFSKLKNEILFGVKNIVNTENEPDETKNEQINDFSNDSFSGFKYNNLSNKNNSNKDNSLSPILIVILIIAGIFIWTNFTNTSNLNKKNNESIQESKVSPEATSSNNSQANNLTTCKICGRRFSGDGYDKIDGVWKQNTNIQTELCSSNCAMVEEQRMNQKYNSILEKHGYKPMDNTQSSTSTHAQPNSNGFFTGSDGQLHQSSPCGYCHHTGFIDNGDGMQVCPMCDGKGEKIY